MNKNIDVRTTASEVTSGVWIVFINYQVSENDNNESSRKIKAYKVFAEEGCDNLVIPAVMVEISGLVAQFRGITMEELR